MDYMERALMRGEKVKDMFLELRRFLLECHPNALEDMDDGLPTFYVGEKTVRFIPLRDHVNVDAAALVAHLDQFTDYKFIRKCILKIYLNQKIPYDALRIVFAETYKA